MKRIIWGGLFLISLALFPAVSSAQVQADIDPSPSSSCVELKTNLRYRSRDAQTNNEVSSLQDFLQSKGYLNSEPTGYMGLLTVKAVKDFQNDNNIDPVTGYVGPVTRAAIKNISCGQTSAAQSLNSLVSSIAIDLTSGIADVQGKNDNFTTVKYKATIGTNGTNPAYLTLEVTCPKYVYAGIPEEDNETRCGKNIRMHKVSDITYTLGLKFRNTTEKPHTITAIVRAYNSAGKLLATSKETTTIKAKEVSDFVDLLVEMLYGTAKDEGFATVSIKGNKSNTTVSTWKLGTVCTTGVTVYKPRKDDVLESICGQTLTYNSLGDTTQNYPILTTGIKNISNTAGKATFTLQAYNTNGELVGTGKNEVTLSAAKDTNRPSVTILSPNGGETFKAGDPITVRWNTNNTPTSAITIISLADSTGANGYYPLDGYCNSTSDLCTNIKTGVYTFSLPANQVPGQYKIRVVCGTKNSEAYCDGLNTSHPEDLSDNYFTITSSASTASSLVTTLSPSNPTAQTYPTNPNSAVQIALMAFDARSSYATSRINQVTVNLETTGTPPTAAYLYNGSTLLASATVTGSTVLFNNLNIALDRDINQTFTIKADFQPSTTQGTTVKASVSGVTYARPDATTATLTNLISGNIHTVSSKTAQWQFLSGSAQTVVQGSNNTLNGIAGTFVLKVKPIGGSMALPTTSDFATILTYSNGTSITAPVSVVSVNGNPTILTEGSEYTINITSAVASSSLTTGTQAVSMKLTSLGATVNNTRVIQTSGLENYKTAPITYTLSSAPSTTITPFITLLSTTDAIQGEYKNFTTITFSAAYNKAIYTPASVKLAVICPAGVYANIPSEETERCGKVISMNKAEDGLYQITLKFRNTNTSRMPILTTAQAYNAAGQSIATNHNSISIQGKTLTSMREQINQMASAIQALTENLKILQASFAQ